MDEVKTEGTEEKPTAPAQEPVKEPTPGPLAQILLKVSPGIKEKAQLQADLAFKYGWIKSATLTQLFIWLTDTFLDSSIKEYIKQRRVAAAAKQNSEVKPHGQ